MSMSPITRRSALKTAACGFGYLALASLMGQRAFAGGTNPALNPLATIRYYDRVIAKDPGAAEDVRLFMLPGVLHCAGGAGPDQADRLAAMVDWVEKGQAPARLVATKRIGTDVVRTRPLCAYPGRAVYKGSGSTDDAANFNCQR